MSKNETKSKRGGMSLGTKVLMVAAIPMILISVIIGIVSARNMSAGMKQEIRIGLGHMTHALDVLYTNINDQEYSLNQDGDMVKGDFNISQNMEVLDEFVEDSDLVVTVFYGDTRMATTILDENGDRLVGTTADASVVDQVIGKGETIEKDNLEIGGQKYYASYEPLKNPDGSVVGMFFVGQPSKNANDLIARKTRIIILIEILIVILSIVFVSILSRGIHAGIEKAENAVQGLANGDLHTKVESGLIRRSDEIGDMARGIGILLHQLVDVVKNIRSSASSLETSGIELEQMANQTKVTSADITQAVDDISTGAQAQADEIEKASGEIEAMGQMIEKITENVDGLNQGSQEIKSASDRSIEIISGLSDSNDRSMEAIQEIAKQVNATNDSAVQIRAAVDLITSIAEETNLLSLNASIEAARAGEQGKGFAVVASQIQKLAEQSNESAGNIADIIENLIANSENTVLVMDNVRKIMNEQHEQLQITKKQFKVVSDGINESTTATEIIKGQTEKCNAARIGIVDVITNLSAISEENAAATQETTASMEEMSDTIEKLAESSTDLLHLAEELEENIEFFHLDQEMVKERIQGVQA